MEESFRRVIDSHRPALGRLIAASEANAERRRDLEQEILLAIWRALPSFEARSSERTFVLRIAHNVAVSHALRGKRDRLRHAVSIDECEPIAESDLDRGALVDRIAKLVDALVPLDRQLLLLWLEGCTAAQIAEVTGLSPNNVAVKVHRIQRVLRTQAEDV